jgi:hypothetical protein
MRPFAAAGLLLLLLFPAARGQTPPTAATQADAARRAEIEQLRREVDALARKVDALTRYIGAMAEQMVTSVQINVLTDYFGGADAANMQPKVLATYPGNLVSASVMLVRTEREGAGNYTNGRSVVIAPGGSALIPVEGADVLCNWEVYDEANAIKVRSDGCSYLARGLRGHFTGATYYRR